MSKRTPTNIITGFLGVGKTTAILSLLEHKPANERWAILVNEFGEIGIDGALLSGQHPEEQGVFIKEVPGGCMCCTSGLPMQIALNMLIARTKPDRLLIEPTGLGHPKEVLDTLHADSYSELLDINATITLVDARNIKDKRYTEHETFNQQLEVADVIVANKTDLYDVDDLANLKTWLNNNSKLKTKPVFSVMNGLLDQEWLVLDTTMRSAEKACCSSHQHGHEHEHEHEHREPKLPSADGKLTTENQGQGFTTQGWQFGPEYCFDYDKVYDLLTSLDVERAKAVFITDKGIVGFNKANDVLTEMFLDETLDSRLEVIGAERLASLKDDLNRCLSS